MWHDITKEKQKNVCRVPFNNLEQAAWPGGRRPPAGCLNVVMLATEHRGCCTRSLVDDRATGGGLDWTCGADPDVWGAISASQWTFPSRPLCGKNQRTFIWTTHVVEEAGWKWTRPFKSQCREALREPVTPRIPLMNKHNFILTTKMSLEPKCWCWTYWRLRSGSFLTNVINSILQSHIVWVEFSLTLELQPIGQTWTCGDSRSFLCHWTTSARLMKLQMMMMMMKMFKMTFLWCSRSPVRLHITALICVERNTERMQRTLVKVSAYISWWLVD